MAHDREFQRKRKDTRMPVRDSHGEDQPAARQTEQDFDLRRARDTPSSVTGKIHRQDIPVQTSSRKLSVEMKGNIWSCSLCLKHSCCSDFSLSIWDIHRNGAKPCWN